MVRLALIAVFCLVALGAIIYKLRVVFYPAKNPAMVVLARPTPPGKLFGDLMDQKKAQVQEKREPSPAPRGAYDLGKRRVSWDQRQCSAYFLG